MPLNTHLVPYGRFSSSQENMTTPSQSIPLQSTPPQSTPPLIRQSPGKHGRTAPKGPERTARKSRPGFITGAADDDPSGIATYAQTGAIFGYGQLWLVWFTCPFMIVIQQMCGRIGMVTGKGLAGVILEHYSRRVLYVTVSLLVIANTINIGADLGAMASSAQMLLGLPFLFWLVFITGSVIVLEIFVPYRIYSRILKYLALTLFSYVLAALVVKLDWKVVFHATLVPHLEFSADYLFNIVAILGTTISPYLFFWQASQEVEEEIVNGQILDMGIGKPQVTRRGVAEVDWGHGRRDVFLPGHHVLHYRHHGRHPARRRESPQSRRRHRRPRPCGRWPAISPTCFSRPGSSALDFSRFRCWPARRRMPWPRQPG